jgi:hypothetical protein
MLISDPSPPTASSICDGSDTRYKRRLRSLDTGLKPRRRDADNMDEYPIRIPKGVAMNPNRTRAYRRVMTTLAELGPSKLLSAEQDRIRLAADNLVFSSDLGEDIAAQEALEDTSRLCRALIECGRWEQITAARLASDLRACGPDPQPELRAA